jgi:hypothetical protein
MMIQLKSSNKKELNTLGITLFEDQIVRTLILTDNFDFLKLLSKKYQVVIFTNKLLGLFLEENLLRLKIDGIKIVRMNEIQESRIQKVLSFCLKWSDPSPATIRNLEREKASGRIYFFGILVRRIFYILFSRFVFLKKIFRYFYYTLYSPSKVSSASLIQLPKLDALFATALTNSESDLPLAIYYKKLSTLVIGSLRSWDNLVTKGSLKFQPDLFFSHSEYMTRLARVIHGVKKNSLVSSVTPAYQKKFKPKNRRQSSTQIEVAYGCIGPVLNPDELNFISLLADLSTEVKAHITVVQHPKFMHQLDDINTGKLTFRKFEFLSTTLNEYYNFIAEQDFVIASGTSFALDSLFVGTPLFNLAFEVIEQDFWLSHLRSFDSLPHSKYLFDKLMIKKISNKLELIQLLNGNIPWPSETYTEQDLQSITGDINTNFNAQIFNLLD